MNNDPENFSQPPIARLILLAVAIACIAAILLQNLQPLVTVYFLGRATIPIPLSLAILAAFLSGAISAAIANSISSWLSRRNADQADSETNKDTAPKETRRSQVKDEEIKDSTPYPRSQSDRTTKLQDDDDFDDDDDDDDRDEIFVKYIKRP
jgi:uncharacterized integral membrane protein